MLDVKGALHEWLAETFATRTAVEATTLTVVALLLGSCALSRFRRVAAALRVAGLLTALGVLTIGVHFNGWVTRLDAVTTSHLLAHRSVRFDAAASVITHLGSPAATAAAGMICGVLLSWRTRSMIPGIIFIYTLAAAALTDTEFKTVITRPRTAVELLLPIQSEHSYPSGHVLGTGTLLGMIAVWVGMRRSHTMQAWLAGSAVAGTLIVALTRLYLGAHTLTDVIAGGILAGLFVTVGAAMLGALNPHYLSNKTRPPVAAPPNVHSTMRRAQNYAPISKGVVTRSRESPSGQFLEVGGELGSPRRSSPASSR